MVMFTKMKLSLNFKHSVATCTIPVFATINEILCFQSSHWFSKVYRDDIFIQVTKPGFSCPPTFQHSDSHLRSSSQHRFCYTLSLKKYVFEWEWKNLWFCSEISDFWYYISIDGPQARAYSTIALKNHHSFAIVTSKKFLFNAFP
jgi:hypothetical protein